MPRKDRLARNQYMREYYHRNKGIRSNPIPSNPNPTSTHLESTISDRQRSTLVQKERRAAYGDSLDHSTNNFRGSSFHRDSNLPKQRYEAVSIEKDQERDSKPHDTRDDVVVGNHSLSREEVEAIRQAKQSRVELLILKKKVEMQETMHEKRRLEMKLRDSSRPRPPQPNVLTQLAHAMMWKKVLSNRYPSMDDNALTMLAILYAQHS